MTLAPYQLSYNGLVFGANTGIELTQVTGLREAPATRGSDVLKPRQHGAFAGRTLFGERIVQATLEVWAPDGTTRTFQQQLDRLSAAFANIEDPAGLLPLAFNLSPTWVTARQIVARVTKGGIPVDVNYQYGKATCPVEFTCPDPLIYDTATQTASAGLPSTTAGLTFPVTFNATFGASSGGSLQLVNGGNEAISPTWTFTGPCTWPTVTMGAYSLGFQVTLAAGDTLVVDVAARTAVFNGSPRNGTIFSGSTWFKIPPGGSSVGFQTADSTTVTGTVATTCPTAAWGWT